MTTEMFFRPSRTITKITANLSNLGDVNGTLQALNLTSDEIPTTFTKWIDENRLSVVKDQQNCGSCWAMSSTSVLSDRFIIAKNLETLDLNPVIPLSCSTDINKGCDGGLPSECGKFFESHGSGVESDKCMGWNAYCGTNKCLDPPSCSALTCDYNYKASKNSTRSLAVVESNGNINAPLTIISIKADVLKYGPVVACLFMPYSLYDPEFWPETDGVFINGHKFYNNRLVAKFANQKVMGAIVTDWDKLISIDGNPAGHAMSIVGWGVQYVNILKKEIPYWIVRNSWGTKWADKGFFKYAIYSEEMGINTNLGLDVPLLVNRELFGSCTTFLADTQTGSANEVVRQSDNNQNIEISPTITPTKSTYDRQFLIKYLLAPVIFIVCVIVIGVLIRRNWKRVKGVWGEIKVYFTPVSRPITVEKKSIPTPIFTALGGVVAPQEDVENITIQTENVAEQVLKIVETANIQATHQLKQAERRVNEEMQKLENALRERQTATIGVITTDQLKTRTKQAVVSSTSK